MKCHNCSLLHTNCRFSYTVHSEFFTNISSGDWPVYEVTHASSCIRKWLIYQTRGDSSNKGCFGRKTNLFRESGDFAGNRDTWEVFREIWDILGTLTLSKDLILHVIKQYNMHSDMHPLYALVYFMYFDPWKQFNSPWYEKTNQQRFQLK